MNIERPIRSQDVASPSGAGRPRRLYAIVAAVLVALAIAGWLLFDRAGPAAAAAGPAAPTLTVAQPLVRDVAEWDDYVGRFEPSRSVEVRPRVSGQVTAIRFADGAFVRKGQLLFTIDSRPFAAALAEARARVAGARSDLALAQADLARANRLVEDDAVSKSDVDQLAARVRAATAAVAAAEAQVRARALDVEFTQVRAPISGRVSDRRVDAGNLVTAGDTGGGTLLTTINALDPIYFTFTGSEALFLKAKRAEAAGTADAAVEIKLQDETDYRWHGTLDFTDNGLDPRSGTIRARAVIANPSNFLTPGMFGNMRLQTGGSAPALLVPEAAIVTDQARKTLLTVGADGTVVAKPVELGPEIDGLRVVRSGLGRNDRVVIVGIQLARPGDKVEVRQGRIQPAAAASTAPATQPLAGEATFAR